MRKLFAVLMALGLVGALTLSLAGAAAGPKRLIVVCSNAVNQPACEALVERTGAVRIKSLPMVNAVVALAGPASERALQGNPQVVRVEEDGLVSIVAKPPPPPPPPERLPWGVDRIDADLVWPGGNTGAGVKVAVIDTGIDLKHLDLLVAGGINTINPLKSADDDNGHGTHVAGIIAALDNDIGVIGVAPGASLYAVKVLSRTGSGWWSDVIEGLEWSINNQMQVVNMSFGASSAPTTVHDAIKLASGAGIVLVAAAGNSGPGANTVIFPAAYPEVIAVAATDSTDAVASFSSRGPQVELAAPGVSIYSTYKGNSYATLSGTSMASPHGAGAAALVIASGQAGVRALLQTTADDLPPVGLDTSSGYGLVDAQQAATGVQTLP